MVLITILLSGIKIPENTDLAGIIDILSDLRDKVLELSLNELDNKFGSETWCFIAGMDMPRLPDPELRILMEVNDYYNYSGLTSDVKKVFEKHWENLKMNFTKIKSEDPCN
jgi:hypothetical protein